MCHGPLLVFLKYGYLFRHHLLFLDILDGVFGDVVLLIYGDVIVKYDGLFGGEVILDCVYRLPLLLVIVESRVCRIILVSLFDYLRYYSLLQLSLTMQSHELVQFHLEFVVVLQVLLHQRDVIVEVAVSIFVLVDEAELPPSRLGHLLVHQGHHLFVSVRNAHSLRLQGFGTQIFLHFFFLTGRFVSLQWSISVLIENVLLKLVKLVAIINRYPLSVIIQRTEMLG